jgi:hypothetical protein
MHDVPLHVIVSMVLLGAGVAAAVASFVAVFITAPFGARRQPRPVEALE